ncbi:MAG TPA: L,D-transpeptidase [Rhizobiaceae bacterium]|nr:L,D-transpeptidase [Rhizobiaceae bacterium]
MPDLLPASNNITRRKFLTIASAGAASATLAGCVSVPREAPPGATPPSLMPEGTPGLAYYQEMYGPVFDEGYEIPAIPVEKVDPRLFRQVVPDPTGERPGTIVVDTSSHYLYLVLGNGQAMRYGVGLGRAGFEWAGRAVVQYKRKWPKWTPPAEMIARQPELEKYSVENGGMPPGLDNPLGARALYIFQDGVDTLYRLHGSPEWWTIGKSVSSGCVRLMNQDIIDLYDRVPGKAPILVTSYGTSV